MSEPKNLEPVPAVPPVPEQDEDDKFLVGASKIADYIRTLTGIRPAVATVKNWIAAADNPLPTWCVMRRRVAFPDEVAKWVRSKWPRTPSDDAGSPRLPDKW